MKKSAVPGHAYHRLGRLHKGVAGTWRGQLKEEGRVGGITPDTASTHNTHTVHMYVHTTHMQCTHISRERHLHRETVRQTASLVIHTDYSIQLLRSKTLESVRRFGE